jgi:hypothetical protein
MPRLFICFIIVFCCVANLPSLSRADESFFIVNALSEKCIDVRGAPGTNNGDALQLWDCENSGKGPNNSRTDQKWRFIKDGYIQNALSGKCIDVNGAPGVNNGGALHLWDCEFSGRGPGNSPTDQKWRLTDDGFIKNVLSGKCLDVRGAPGLNNGDALQLWDCETTGSGPNGSVTDQRWQLVKASGQVKESVREKATKSTLKWYEYNGHKYALTKVAGNWKQAESEAQENDGHLVTINSKEENNWLLKTFGTKSFWIGLVQDEGSLEPAGGWHWSSGEPMKFINWDSGQPNNYSGADDYGMLLTGTGGRWHDVPLEGWPTESNFQGIIEIPVNALNLTKESAREKSTGRIALEFDTANPERVKSLVWIDNEGNATKNLVAEGGRGMCNDVLEYFGQSYGAPEGAGALPVVAGYRGKVTKTTTGLKITGNKTNCSKAPQLPVTTEYQFFDGAQASQVRISRTFGFGPKTQVYSGIGLRPYVPRLPLGKFSKVIYPNGAGNAITTADAGACGYDCFVKRGPSWNGRWFANIDQTSGIAMIVLRDPSMNSAVQMAINNDSYSNSNLTAFVVEQPAKGWKQPITEVEYLCFADLTSWPQADRDQGLLPQGCGVID